jgi:formate hydrogenlyase subunit 3/multisubunit Na+/H+ antiporter MnhD subunit
VTALPVLAAGAAAAGPAAAADRGPAQDVIVSMAGLLRDTRGSMLLGGSVLSALTVGIALEAALSPLHGFFPAVYHEDWLLPD